MRPPSWLTGNNKLQHHTAVLLLLTPFALQPTSALQVIPGSNCTSLCQSAITADTTNGSDVSCHDSDYNSTASGRVFQACVSCEIQSQTFNDQTEQTNLGWALYNMRYALDWCLFAYPQSKNQTVTNTCTTSCAMISNALETNVLTPNASSTYDYCQDPNFLPNIGACASCYQIIPNQLYLSNFLNTLEYACQNRPSPIQPFYIKPSDIFTHNPPSNWSDIDPTAPSSGGLSHSAKVALCISIPVGAFLILSLLFVWLFVTKQGDPPSISNRQSHRSEKHNSNFSTGWNQAQRSPYRQFDRTRHQTGTQSPRPIPYPTPLSPQKALMPAPLRPQKSNSSIPFSKVFGSPMFDQPLPLRPQISNSSIPFLPATRYSPPPPEPKMGPSLSTRAQRPSGPRSGLVSWERIAIQNAHIRATQGPSPSPVSPLTQVQVVPLPRSTGHRQSTPFRHDSPFRQDSPFRYDQALTQNQPYRQDSLIPLNRPSREESLLRRPSSSTLGTTHLLSPDPPPPRRTRRSGRSDIQEAEPPRRRDTPGQGEALKEDAPPVPMRMDMASSPMLPLSPIQPLSPILRSDTLRSTHTLSRPDTLRLSMRTDTPNPDDGILARRSGTSGVMRSGSGKSARARKEVRWSRDVDYEAGWR